MTAGRAVGRAHLQELVSHVHERPGPDRIRTGVLVQAAQLTYVRCIKLFTWSGEYTPVEVHHELEALQVAVQSEAPELGGQHGALPPGTILLAERCVGPEVERRVVGRNPL